MESRYVKLDYEEALSAKKEILSSEMNLLNISKYIENYKQLRKKELLNKLKLKSLMTELKAKLNTIQSSLPEEGEKVKIRVRRAEKNKTPKSRRIEDELEDIKNKLARLQ